MKRYKKLFEEKEEISMEDINDAFSETSFNDVVTELIELLKEKEIIDIKNIDIWFNKQFDKRNIVNEKIRNLIKDFVLYFKCQSVLKEG